MFTRATRFRRRARRSSSDKMHDVETWVALPVALSLVLFTAVAIASVALTWLARRARGRRPRREVLVSILKPLAGAEAELAENLASFAHLEGRYEILFGVASADDAAVGPARAFMARYPKVAARLLVTDPEAAVNPKVAQLMGLLAAAKGEVVVVSDSNVRVPRDYLTALCCELERPGVGLVTSLIGGTGERNLGAALENLQLGAVIAPAVATSQLVLQRPLTVGKSMAMYRRDAVRIGALDRVADLLAEDYVLGRVFAEAGLEVRTSYVAVENRNVRSSLRRVVERHTRWAKMRRAISPATFFLEPLMAPVAVATPAFVLAPCRTTAVLLLTSALVQTAGAWVTTRVLRGRWLAARYLPLEIARTFVLLFCWAMACASRRVSWRGHAFQLGKDSRITPIATAEPIGQPEA
jgi:ceramide glucosyltransferase